MKKIGIITSTIVLFALVMSSCKSSGPHCAAYSKANSPKVKNIQPI